MDATPRHGRPALVAFAVLALVAVLVVAATDRSDDVALTVALAPAPGGSDHPTLTVTPSTGLVDHQLVEVHGEGFDPRAAAAIWQCGADDRQDCTWDQSEIEDDGSFTVPVAVSMTHCGDHPATCLEVNTFDQDVRYYERIGTIPIAFDPDAPRQPDPTFQIDAPADLATGDVVTIEAAHLRPGDSVVVTVCSGRRAFPQGRCASPTGGGDRAEPGADDTLVVPLVASPVLTDMSGRAFDCRRVACTLSVTTPEDWAFERATSVPLDFDVDATAASPPPTASARFVEGRTLEVHGEGFVPTEEVYATTCIKRDGPKQCLFPTEVHATAGGDGTVEIAYEPEPFDGFAGVEDCRGANCFVLVWGSALGGDGRDSVRAPFALDP